MDQVQLYSKYNGLQKNDASFVIENYLRLIKWNFDAKENILDVGCGDGNVTFEFVFPRLPKNVEKLIGADISENMVKYALQNYNHPKISFILLDVSSENIPIDLKNNFNHIVSFYCLHWITNQRQAFKNIYDMLKPGGDILLTFLASNPIYDIYEKIAKSCKWGKYMQNFRNYISPYHKLTNPEQNLDNLLKNQGFTSRVCRIEKRTYVYPNFSILRQSFFAVNPFIGKIPKNEINNYIDDYISVVRKLENVTIETCNNNNDEEKIIIMYKLFVVYASKPF